MPTTDAGCKNSPSCITLYCGSIQFGWSACHSPTCCTINTTTATLVLRQLCRGTLCGWLKFHIAHFLKYISVWNSWKLLPGKNPWPWHTCRCTVTQGEAWHPDTDCMRAEHYFLQSAVLTAVFFPLLALIINKPHGSLHLLIAAATVIWHRRLPGLTFTQKSGRAFLFLILVNLFAISQCQTDARTQSIRFTQEWLGHAGVNHSWFIISAAADTFLVQKLCDVRDDGFKDQAFLERSSGAGCTSQL